jgi:signal transduction histidine kinase
VADSVDVRELLGDSVEAWRAAAHARGASLALEWSGAAGWVRGERLRLAQATGNLIANAIEHGGGLVVVRGRVVGSAAASAAASATDSAASATDSAASAGSERVRIEVIDGGPGLPATVTELARRPRGGRGSRGRGLAIAAAIARGHGGRLAAAPSERGARLGLDLPAA